MTALAQHCPEGPLALESWPVQAAIRLADTEDPAGYVQAREEFIGLADAHLTRVSIKACRSWGIPCQHQPRVRQMIVTALRDGLHVLAHEGHDFAAPVWSTPDGIRLRGELAQLAAEVGVSLRARRAEQLAHTRAQVRALKEGSLRPSSVPAGAQECTAVLSQAAHRVALEGAPASHELSPAVAELTISELADFVMPSGGNVTAPAPGRGLEPNIADVVPMQEARRTRLVRSAARARVATATAVASSAMLLGSFSIAAADLPDASPAKTPVAVSLAEVAQSPTDEVPPAFELHPETGIPTLSVLHSTLADTRDQDAAVQPAVPATSIGDVTSPAPASGTGVRQYPHSPQASVVPETSRSAAQGDQRSARDNSRRQDRPSSSPAPSQVGSQPSTSSDSRQGSPARPETPRVETGQRGSVGGPSSTPGHSSGNGRGNGGQQTSPPGHSGGNSTGRPEISNPRPSTGNGPGNSGRPATPPGHSRGSNGSPGSGPSHSGPSFTPPGLSKGNSQRPDTTPPGNSSGGSASSNRGSSGPSFTPPGHAKGNGAAGNAGSQRQQVGPQGLPSPSSQAPMRGLSGMARTQPVPPQELGERAPMRHLDGQAPEETAGPTPVEERAERAPMPAHSFSLEVPVPQHEAPADTEHEVVPEDVVVWVDVAEIEVEYQADSIGL